MLTGLNLGRNSFLNHSSPFLAIKYLLVAIPASKGTTTKIRTEATS